MKKINSLLIASLIITLGSCSSANDKTNANLILNPSDINVRNTYSNKFDETRIPEQWSDYGSGDPFVLRYNGKYYLYVSTKNYQKGILAWESDDLLTWKQVDNKVLEKGYVTMDENATFAYAPEVMYFNGYFYLVESAAGRGHYILRSKNPEGPFESITDNFGEGIDGSFFVDDDEQIYFLRASTTGVRIAKLDETDNFAIVGSQKKLDNTQLGGWTEGPYLLKNNGTYYLTYTGNGVTSSGYRVGYSYYNGDMENMFKRDAYTQGKGFVLLNTDDNFNGLGHSSTVLGPDLDSYYIAYHNLNSPAGPNRSFNISRLFFSGSDMYASHAELENNFVPNKPDFYTANDEFESQGEFLLSKDSTKESFTAEFNYLTANVKCVFSYVDENNYSYVKMSSDDILSLVAVKSGTEKEIKSVKMNKKYDYSKLHTIRVAYNEGLIDVFFDNMCKIDDVEFTTSSGKIGYLNCTKENVEYTAFTNSAFGMSDKEEIKQDKALAVHYSDKYSSVSKETRKIEQKENDDAEFNGDKGAYDLLLSGKHDRVTYPFYFEQAGYKGLNITLDKKYCGKTICFQVDNEKAVRIKIPSVGKVEGQYVKVYVGDFEIGSGAHFVSFITDKEEIAFHDFELFKSSNKQPTFENSLSTFIGTGVNYVNSWKIKDEGHYAVESNRQCLYVGDESLSDYTIECDVKLVGKTSSNTAGFIFRAANPAFSSIDTYSSIQGYYVGFNNSKAVISKCNYDKSSLDLKAHVQVFEDNTYYHFKVILKGNTITVQINDNIKMSFTDDLAFTYGHFGLYTDGAAAVYKNLKIY